ncbi:aminotransferase class I/II-fold pyridoxal phosphate-dependent enzyme [uncultured Microscilla sp.]|uniref:pyridoxal phosphate-dependent aminotransferase n=1 Tax=uncultured Microscilla sp. TaxID=432653 RepID=UPI002609965E|nr:aminotransferase class I/II-fold pyridoxal phosphate-dependent enzyme [uncultured Microscilla sp.]
MLYGHGDDVYLQPHTIEANFSTNVYEAPGLLGLKQYVFEQWHTVASYPEVLAESLRQRIANHHQVSEKQVLVLNGAEEGIHLVAQLYAGKSTTIFTPTFAEYEDACKIHHHHSITFVPGKHLLHWKPQGATLTFICNPNNPTGTTVPVEHIAYLLEQYPTTIFCIDEAFIDFTEVIDSHVPLIRDYPNLIVLKSLTKNFAIPGLRLGYLLAAEPLIRAIQSIKVAWSVNALAIAAGKYIFDHYAEISPAIHSLLVEKKRWLAELQQIPHFEWIESDTHFWLGKVLNGTAQELKDYLSHEHRLLIRNATNFRGLDHQYFRVATLTAEKNNLLTQALKAWNATR